MDTMNSPAAVLVPANQLALWERVNTTPDPPAISVVDRVLAVARTYPDHPAVLASRRELTYLDLIRLAQTVADRIVAAGASGQRLRTVAICVEPGWEQVVGVVAAGLAGVAWHALNPAAAQSARWRLINDTGSRVVLTQSWLEDRLRWPEGIERITVDQTPPTETPPTETAAALATPDAVACLLDRGDGGLVPVTHRGVTTLAGELGARFGLGPDDRILLVCPLGDEVAAGAIFTMLCSGGSVVIPDDIDLWTPAAWVELINAHRITVWHSPPALGALLVEHLRGRGDDIPSTLRLAAFGGEPLSLPVFVELRALVGDGLRVVNLGPGLPVGLWSTCHEIVEPDRRRGHLPVGTPLAGRRVYVLDESLTPCPVWVSGALHVGGRTLPATDLENDDRVVTLPGTGEPFYRTGHTGRLLPDGTIDIVGDDEARTTVSGHPLNLRDVEAALATHPAVLAAAAVAAGDSSIAYVKALQGEQLTSADVLTHLRKKMSPYLLPSRVEIVGALPLTVAGRTDRKALAQRADPAVPTGVDTAAALDAPPSELLLRVCALAARILDVGDVDPDMNLLDLGATSVQIVRLATQAESEFGIQVDVEELLRFPSVGVLVSFATPDAAGAGPVEESPAGASAELLDAATSAHAGLILDPVARLAFKDRRLGVRHDLDDRPTITVGGEEDLARLARRRTVRRFTAAPVPEHALGALLAALRRLDGWSGAEPAPSESGLEPRHAYPSAGSLYPVQLYLTVGAGRVDGVPAGAYYYHPERHRLAGLDPDAILVDTAHAWINREAFRTSAFSFYLVANLNAIGPMYGDRARDYCLIEAGAICQLLMSVAVDHGLGLCPIGEVDSRAVSDLLKLGDGQELVHTVVGGRPDPHAAAMAIREAGMLRRLAKAAGEVTERRVS